MAIITSNLWLDLNAETGFSNDANGNLNSWISQDASGIRALKIDSSITGVESPIRETNVLNGKAVMSSIGKNTSMILDFNHVMTDLSITGGTVYLVGLQSKTNAVASNFDSGTSFLLAGDSGNLDISRANFVINNLDSISAGIATASDDRVVSQPVVAENTFYSIRLRYDPATSMNYISINNGTEVAELTTPQAYAATPLSVFCQGNKKIARILIYTENHSKSSRDITETEIKSLYGFSYSVDPPLQNAVINFSPLSNKTVGEADFTLNATSNSPGLITYVSSNPSVAVISGNSVHLLSPGSTLITATQASDPGYITATPVARNLSVAPASSGGGTSSSYPTGLVYLDGYDIWKAWGMVISKGSADFLQYPGRKQSTTHDWLDANGVDVDVSSVYFSSRKITLNCCRIAEDEAKFWQYHNQFLTQITKPGKHRLELSAHGGRQYYVIYEECTNYTQLRALTGKDVPPYAQGKIGHQFTLILLEPEPKIENLATAIADEAGRVLIT